MSVNELNVERVRLTDGGLETCLIYDHGHQLPHFAAFPLLSSPEGRASLAAYYRQFREVAEEQERSLVLTTATWRASPDWASELGLPWAEVEEANMAAVALVREVGGAGVDVAGGVGPRGDGYKAVESTVEAAWDYHRAQVGVLARAGVDHVAGETLATWQEAAGVALACKETAVPVAIGFTVETSGRLPSGQGLAEAVARVEEESGGYPVYYYINCAHPYHFLPVLQEARGQAWLERVGGIRPNASSKSHEELDNSTELDSGDPGELGELVVEVARLLPRLTMVGGCCGTSAHHIRAMGAALKTINR